MNRYKAGTQGMTRDPNGGWVEWDKVSPLLMETREVNTLGSPEWNRMMGERILGLLEKHCELLADMHAAVCRAPTIFMPLEKQND